jgi:hypothetical protein
MIKFKDVSVREAAWVIHAYTDESKREERIALMRAWPELYDALESLATGHVPVRSSKAD